MKNFKNTLIQITQYGMGTGDKELGLQLITNYLKLMSEENNLPQFIAFYNEGVRLICQESPVLKSLQQIEERGTKLIACKTCLNHFELVDKIEVGIAGSMLDIIELQRMSKKVISL